MRDAPGGQLPSGKDLAGAVGVVGQQQFIALAQEGHVHQRQSRQAAGRQHAVTPAFHGGDAFFQDESGGRAVQAVGVAAFVHPLLCAQGLHVGEDDGGRLVNAGRDGLKALGGAIGVVDQLCGDLAHSDQSFHFSSSCAGRMAS
ncbi:hypothetical protein D9M69_661670 [compost metagenome]